MLKKGPEMKPRPTLALIPTTAHRSQETKWLFDTLLKFSEDGWLIREAMLTHQLGPLVLGKLNLNL